MSKGIIPRMFWNFSFLLFKFMFFVAFIALPFGKALPDEKFKVLFLTIDSLRAENLSCYGNKRKTTPNIDELAEEGIVFRKFYAVSGWTSPSLVSIFSSLFPTTHGVLVRGLVLNQNIKTPVEALRENGWRTYAEHWTGDTIGNLGFEFSGNNIFDFLKKHKDETFFVWFHLRGPHLPYDPPEEYINLFLSESKINLKNVNYEKLKPILEKKTVYKESEKIELSEDEIEYVKLLYDADLRRQDDEVGKIINLLKELGIYDKTVVVITADHGEELFEHGWVGHASTSRNSSLYEEILKIPLIIRVPGIERLDVDVLASQVDIMPTLLEILGVKKSDFDTDGVSLVSFDRKKNRVKVKDVGKRVVFAESSPCGWQCKENEKWKRVFALIEDNYKIIYSNFSGDFPYDVFELYRLPDEKNNLREKESEKLSYMIRKLFEKISESRVKAVKIGLPERVISN
ncbi:Choline-sulfatase [bacterium HR19]|nr:Choline-sulfatase [bacterium HR19]